MAKFPFPPEFLEAMRAMLGPEYDEFERALQSPNQSALRINPLKADAYEAAQNFIGEPVPWEPSGYYFDPALKPGTSPLHDAGAYYIQDASAMAPARVLNAQPGEFVLDLCAAPGGKSGQIAQQLKNTGFLVSNEPDANRAKVLSSNLERLGVANAMVTCAYPDALADRWGSLFDALLVDAPCSGEGMFRKDEQARQEWSPHAPVGCALRQAEILDQAARLLKPGGRLVYSTCTFNLTENEHTVQAFLQRHPEFLPQDFALPGVGQSAQGMLRLWPHKLKGEGHFVAKLVKSSSAAKPASPKKSKPLKKTRHKSQTPGTRQAVDLFEHQVVCKWPEYFSTYRFEMRGDLLWAQPNALPSPDGLRVLRAGLCVGKLGKNYVQPDHALAMALCPENVHVAQALSQEQTIMALHGHPIEADGPNGWVLLCHQGIGIGWGKRSNGIIKNHIPKGLRWK